MKYYATTLEGRLREELRRLSNEHGMVLKWNKLNKADKYELRRVLGMIGRIYNVDVNLNPQPAGSRMERIDAYIKEQDNTMLAEDEKKVINA